MKKQGFTLIELLIVTVVIVTLMGVVFRLAGIGTDARSKNVTIAKLQKIENALSGYYAAYGQYPPVPLHGYRDYHHETDGTGLQSSNLKTLKFSEDNYELKRAIEAACRSQPIAVRYPYNTDRKQYIVAVAEQCRLYSTMQGAAYKSWRDRSSVFSKLFSCLDRNTIDATKREKCSSWYEEQNSVRIFQFGLLSFLLPRYLFMLQGDSQFYDDCAQWTQNNLLPYKFDTGRSFDDWSKVQSALGTGEGNTGGGLHNEATMITNQPNMAVCARWMPNFEGIIRGGKTFYGVDTQEGSSEINNLDSANIQIFAPDYDSGGNQYVLDGMTIWDGWWNEIYYYSEPPYQSYRLWSAGPDGRTFPPWVDLKTLNANDAKFAAKWMSDDIVHMSN